MTMLNRRTVLRASAQLTLLAPFARLANAGASADSRFVLVVLRGGLDGLAAVAPYGEPQYANARGELALGKPGSENGVLDLDGTIGLHPALANLHALYRAGEASVLHAVATPYRERSHFDAQNVLEGGGMQPNGASGGWLNRALAELGRAGQPRDAVAIASSVPLVLRGELAVSSWAPSRLPDADADLIDRVRAMYAAVDPTLAARLDEALGTRDMAGDAGMSGERMRAGGGANVGPLATAAGRFLAAAEGPRVAVLDIGGWDTHANQGGAQGALALRLRGLDSGLAQLKDALSAAWRDTTVLVVTEFGRTVAVNGTRGTDHGTAACVFLAGGAVQGGRVLADWPGLAQRDLHEGRDLRATTDLRSVLKGVLAGALGVPETALERDVFPGSAAARPARDLLA
jgi:uncharacterized protein (DUF1501 family)